MKYRSTISVFNSSEDKKIVILEPWAEEYEVMPNQKLEIKAESDDAGEFEIEFIGTYEDTETIVVYGWAGCIVEVFSKGEKISRTTDIKVPEIPKEMNMSAFLKNLFEKN